MDNGQWTTDNVGKILESPKGMICVSCGNQTVLQIEELQLEGKKRMNVRDFLNGVKLEVGEILS